MMTFSDVKTHFEANRAHPADLNWDDLYRLSPAEARAVRASLQTFQRGEGTGGNHLLALATQWQWEEPDYAATMQLFIQEEKGHADMLGQFMVQQGIPRLETHWLHEIFPAPGLGTHGASDMTAEVVAAVYYRALRQATLSGLLRQICHRILHDEEMHLAFHCLAIQQWSENRSRLSSWLWQQFYRGLMAGTALVVYAASHRTFRAAGYGPGRFSRTIAAEYSRLEQRQQANATIAPRVVPQPPAASQNPLLGLGTLKNKVLLKNK